jgi:PLP dependent protein
MASPDQASAQDHKDQTFVSEQISQIQKDLPQHVRLIAVTKQVSVALIRQAYDAGVRDFAENRVQEALAKQAELQDLSDISWHLIGHLQTNKAKTALHHFNWIHTVDSLKLAQRLQQLALDQHCQPNILLQVKPLPDPTKQGWEITELLASLPVLNQLSALKIRGLMVILPLGLDATQQLAAFQQVQQLTNQINSQHWPNLSLTELSMGMSQDYPLAIQAGATMVRLGRIIFGDR